MSAACQSRCPRLAERTGHGGWESSERSGVLAAPTRIYSGGSEEPTAGPRSEPLRRKDGLGCSAENTSQGSRENSVDQ